MITATTMTDSIKVIESALNRGISLIELITGYTKQQLASYIMSIKDFVFQSPVTSSVNGIPVERSLSKSLCCFLIELRKNGDSHYADIRKVVKAKYGHMVNDYSVLKYWRLIEKSDKGNGYWRINERGMAFIEDRLRLAERLTICNKKVIGHSNKLVRIDDYIDLKKVSYNQ